MRFHVPNNHSGAKTCPALARLYLGSASAANIRFSLILFDFDFEKRYGRDTVAFTLAFWRRLAPEREIERDLFTIISVFIVKIDENQ